MYLFLYKYIFIPSQSPCIVSFIIVVVVIIIIIIIINIII